MTDQPWQPKPCPFCHDTNITLQVEFGDVFKLDVFYAVCNNGHRCKDQPYDRTVKGAASAAAQRARDDWDTRIPPKLTPEEQADMKAKAEYYK